MLAKDLYWLAGLLEGEGCFREGHKGVGFPRLKVNMTDRDVVARAAELLGTKLHGPHARVCPSGKPAQSQYIAEVTGDAAAGWMMTLYSLLGLRRRAKIREVLSSWKSRVRTRRYFGRGAGRRSRR